MLATTHLAPTRADARPSLNRPASMQPRAAFSRARPTTRRPLRSPLKVLQVLDLSSAPPQTVTPNPALPQAIPPASASADAIAIAAPAPAEPKPESYVPPAALSAFQWYAGCLEAHPILTKSLTAFLGFCLGDALAQSIEGTHAHLDAFRTLRLGSYGLILDGPIQHFWYRFLDRTVWPEDSTSMKAVVTKTAADQLLWSPLMTCVFFTWLKVLEGHPDAVLATIQAKVLPTLAANYLFWPLVHMFNFRYIPGEWRVLYNQVMCIAWIGFVSLLTHHGITVSDWSF